MSWAHIDKSKRWPPMSDEDYKRKIRDRSIETDSGCWLWTGFKFRKGYGGTSYRGKAWTVHRLAYHLWKGPVPKGVFVCHTCDNPGCVNPDHLWIGTAAENNEDMKRKGRLQLTKRGHQLCPKGHKMVGDNLYIDPRGFRSCRTCARIRNRLKAGWPTHLAETLASTPHGRRPVNARFPRNRTAASGTDSQSEDV